jgi:heme exporter protein D
MSFSSFADFIHMGGHGLFVWSCYAITLVVLVANILRPLQLKKKLIQQKLRALRLEAEQPVAPTGE